VQVVIAGVVTFTVVCGLAVLGQVAAGGPGVPATTAVVQVGAGETVWDVARRVAPDAATPAVVQRIRELNAMAGSELRPGQQLRVPDGR
jgi:Tfp pilus assembly protein FimV